jgi:hypothetical protein
MKFIDHMLAEIIVSVLVALPFAFLLAAILWGLK